jgi:hypothetical protein
MEVIMIERLVRSAVRRKLPKRMVLRRHSLLDGEGALAGEQRLERAAATFVGGLWAAVEERSLAKLRGRLSSYGSWERGFAFEGAAMGLCLLDNTVWWRRRHMAEFVEKWGANYVYLIYVGAGWAFACQHISPSRVLQRLENLWGWLAVDGYGFYLGLFESDDTPDREVLTRCKGYVGRVLRQGYGRALWFLTRGSVSTMARAIERLPKDWRDDLWSGIGLACVYAGDLASDELVRLRELAGEARPAVALGAAFAAKARKSAGGLCCDPADKDARVNADYYNIACEILCGVDAQTAAYITDDALDDLPPDAEQPAYEVWRNRVEKALQDVSMRTANSPVCANVWCNGWAGDHYVKSQKYQESTADGAGR